MTFKITQIRVVCDKCVFCGHHYLTWLNHPSILERKTKDAD